MTRFDPDLTIVTLTRDNPLELELTLRSVLLQTRRPARHLVIDGSSNEYAKIAKALAFQAGAGYFWRKPSGIYDAMEFSVELLSDGEFAMWLNSSDWLAGPDVLDQINEQLRNGGAETAWMIGQLVRRSSKEMSLHRGVLRERQFASQIRAGLIGFPHPSTVFRVQALREAGAFSQGASLRVARDYDLALRMLGAHGGPRLVRSVFTVHVPEGFTSKAPARAFVERVRSRLQNLPWPEKFASLLLLPLLAITAVTRSLRPQKRDAGLWAVLLEKTPRHYCQENQYSEWPICCDETLGVSKVYPNLTRI